MSEEPGKYQDEISARIDQWVAQSRAHFTYDAERLTRALKSVRKVIAYALDVEPEKIKRKHIAQFLRQMPDATLMRYRGISRVTITQAREEIKNDPE